MQVFVPYANPVKTAKCLDNRRLAKQIIETIQILSANTGIDVGWKIPKYCINHPVTKSWKDDSNYLIGYLAWLLNEYLVRKNKHHKCSEIFFKYFLNYVEEGINSNYKIKHLTSEFCKQHQQKLLDKFPEHYKKYFL